MTQQEMDKLQLLLCKTCFALVQKTFKLQEPLPAYKETPDEVRLMLPGGSSFRVTEFRNTVGLANGDSETF